MAEQAVPAAAIIVALPAEIDIDNADHAYDQLYAAFAAGAPMVIADFTATTFCDTASLRRLVAVQRRAVARNAQLRLAAPPGNPVRHVLEITGRPPGADRPAAASAPTPAAGQIIRPAGRAGEPAVTGPVLSRPGCPRQASSGQAASLTARSRSRAGARPLVWFLTWVAEPLRTVLLMVITPGFPPYGSGQEALKARLT